MSNEGWAASSPSPQSGWHTLRIAAKAVGVVVLIYGALFAVGAAYRSGWFHGRLPPDTLAQTESQAEDVAFSVASNAGCGDFDSEESYAFDDAWQFDCTIGGVSYRVYVYGGDQARSQGLAQLQAGGRPYVARAYYAVTAIPSGASKDEVLNATPPPESIVDPFR